MTNEEINKNKNNLKVGDIIMVEEAWEDEAGQYHDESAKIIAIKENGELELNFFAASKQVQDFLRGTDGYMANDFEKELEI